MNAVTENPHFARISRAPYEIVRLLKQLPTNFSAYEPLAPDDRLIAEAARQHATNANDTLMRGLEAIGAVASLAGANQEGQVEGSTLVALGELLTHLSAEAQAMQELDWSIGDVLDADDLRAAQKKPLQAMQKGGVK